MAKRVKNASGTFRRQWHNVQMESTSGVYRKSSVDPRSTFRLHIVSLTATCAVCIFFTCLAIYIRHSEVISVNRFLLRFVAE